MITLILIFIFTTITILLYYLFNLILSRKLVIKKLFGNKKDFILNKTSEARLLTRPKSLESKDNLVYKLENRLNNVYISMSINKFIRIILISCILVFTLIFTTTSSILLSIIASFLILLITHFYLSYLEGRKIKLFSAQLLDLVSSLSSCLKSGYGIIQALTKIQEESPSPMSIELSLTLEDINIGRSYEEAFSKMIERNPVEELEILLTAIIITRETGGNLSYILDMVSGTIRYRERLKGEITSLTAQGRLSGIILVLMPFAISLFIYIMNPTYISLLFTNSVGKLLLAVGIAGQIIGAFVIKNIIKIDW